MVVIAVGAPGCGYGQGGGEADGNEHCGVDVEQRERGPVVLRLGEMNTVTGSNYMAENVEERMVDGVLQRTVEIGNYKSTNPPVEDVRTVPDCSPYTFYGADTIIEIREEDVAVWPLTQEDFDVVSAKLTYS